MNRIAAFTLILVTFSLLSITVPAPARATPLGLTWATKAPIPYATGQAAVVTGKDGRIYVMGGFSGGNANTTARAYNPTTDTWTDLQPLPVPTRGAAVATTANGLIYVIGGYASGYVNANQVYNITSNTWAIASPEPTGVWEAGVAAGNDGRIYIIGGENGLTLVQIYNPTTGMWSSGTALPTGREHLRAVKAPDGLIYAIGGNVAAGTVEEYDPAGNSWRAVAPMLRAKASFGATLGPDGLIYTFGGTAYNSGGNDASPYLNTVEAYDPVADQWFTVGLLTVARRELSAATAPNGKMYIVGGGNGTYLTTDDEARVAYPNQIPIARIYSIAPSPVTTGTTITFNGTGTDSDGTIMAYKWRSSISGTIGTTATFTTSTLAAGTHNIYFSVEDNSGAWSTETQAVVTVNSPVSSDPTYQAVQTTMLVAMITLAAAVAAVIIAAYNLMSRKKPGPSPTPA